MPTHPQTQGGTEGAWCRETPHPRAADDRHTAQGVRSHWDRGQNCWQFLSNSLARSSVPVPLPELPFPPGVHLATPAHHPCRGEAPTPSPGPGRPCSISSSHCGKERLGVVWLCLSRGCRLCRGRGLCLGDPPTLCQQVKSCWVGCVGAGIVLENPGQK